MKSIKLLASQENIDSIQNHFHGDKVFKKLISRKNNINEVLVFNILMKHQSLTTHLSLMRVFSCEFDSFLSKYRNMDSEVSLNLFEIKHVLFNLLTTKSVYDFNCTHVMNLINAWSCRDISLHTVEELDFIEAFLISLYNNPGNILSHSCLVEIEEIISQVSYKRYLMSKKGVSKIIKKSYKKYKIQYKSGIKQESLFINNGVILDSGRVVSDNIRTITGISLSDEKVKDLMVKAFSYPVGIHRYNIISKAINDDVLKLRDSFNYGLSKYSVLNLGIFSDDEIDFISNMSSVKNYEDFGGAIYDLSKIYGIDRAKSVKKIPIDASSNSDGVFCFKLGSNINDVFFRSFLETIHILKLSYLLRV